MCVLALALLLLGGCTSYVTNPANWAGPDAGSVSKADLYECRRDATYHGHVATRGVLVPVSEVDLGLFTACMEAKGYHRR